MSRRPPGPCRARSAAGFTLVELLATLVLMGIVLPVAMHGLSVCLDTAAHARSQAEASALAETKLAECVTGGQWTDAESEGDFGDEWPGYRWAAQTEAWEDSRLREIDVLVTWTRHGKDYGVTMSTLVYTGSANE
jgi:prepilin-type N-terminal cleavage/methylation domain-containing protein